MIAAITTAALLALGAADAAPVPAGGGLVMREVLVDGTAHRVALRLPPGYDPARPWPLVVFLHGSGECGTDGEKQTKVGLPPAVAAAPDRWPCLLLMPQKPSDQEEWEEREPLVLAAIADARAACSVDSARIALTGMSQGGHGAWMLAARHPRLFSRVAPVCGYGRAHTIARRVARLPVWAFHGLRDDVVDPAETRRIVEEIRAARRELGLDPAAARMTLYPEANHNSWDPAYAEPELPAWLLAPRVD